MYPPRFNLRYFMSHLAPGGYCFLYVLVFLFAFYWLFLPCLVQRLPLVEIDAALVTIAFVILIVVSYFVGVVLRLPAVDDVDLVSIEFRLRHKLGKRLNFLKRSFVSQIVSFFCPLGPRSLKIGDLSDVKKFDLFSDSTGKGKLDKEWKLRDGIRYLAAEKIKAAAKAAQPGAIPEIDAEKLRSLWDETNGPIMDWLWLADEFPYPLWVTYKVQLQSTPARRAEFNEHLWEIMVETMRGCTDARVGHENTFSKEAFNRCKSVINMSSRELAAEIYDREALTRMMAGFYRGLWLASRGSLVLLILVLGLIAWLSLGGSSGHDPTWAWSWIIFFTASTLFNLILLRKVVLNFLVLRLSEGQAVFDSFILMSKQLSRT